MKELVLAIETSNPACSPGGGGEVGLARVLGDDVEMLAREAVQEPGAPGEGLLAAVGRMVSRAGASPSGLGCVVVSQGPGGFTAVRVAVTAGKFVGEATGARCVGVPSAWVGAWNARGRGPFVVLLASKGATAWATGFDEHGAEVAPGRLVDAEDLAELAARLGARRLVGDEHLPSEMVGWAGTSGVSLEAPRLDAEACVRCAVRAGLDSLAVDPVELMPIYPREPEAVTKWRRLHGKG